MNFETMHKEMQLDILQAGRNKTCKKLLDNAKNLHWEDRIIMECSIAIAYTQWLKDWYKPKENKFRI